MRSRARSLAAAVLAAAATPALAGPASAATVRLDRIEEQDEGSSSVFGHVVVTAAPGEANTVEVTYVPGPTDVIRVTDTTAPPVAGTGCRAVAPATVACSDARAPDIEELVADLGDMDDSAVFAGAELGDLVLRGGAGNDRLSGLGARLEGGEGDDQLTGSPARDDLQGEAGADVLDGGGDGDYLDGGPGDDVLHGGDGDDQLYAGGSFPDPAPAGHDLLDGGPGNDTLSDEDELGPSREIGPDTLIGGDGTDTVSSYILRSAPVRVDLTRSTGQGAAGENDTLEGVEDVTGGTGADTLIGNDAPNRLDGGKGRDRLRGGGGDDHLVSTVSAAEDRENAAARRYGPDAVSGDAGDDLIETLPAMASRIACGAGDDRVALLGFASDRARSSLGPLVSRSCERLAMEAGRPARSVAMDPSPVRATAGRLVFRLPRVRCCAHVMQIKRLARGQTVLATAPIRGHRVSLAVGRRVIRASGRTPVRLRGTISKVASNRFVWRFEIGRAAF